MRTLIVRTPRFSLAAFTIGLLGLALAGATAVDAQTSAEASPPPAAAPETKPEAVIDPIIAEVRRRLAEPARGNVDRGDRAALAEFYAARTEGPLWAGSGGFTARAEHAMAEIARADEWGLNAAQFELPKLAGAAEAPALADAEIKLGYAVLKYARHARGGRVDPQQLSQNLDQKLALRDPKVVLAGLAATEMPGTYLTSLHPQHEQFQKLRQALLKARAGDVEPEPVKPLFVVIPDGPQLKTGMKHANVSLLRQRLGLAARPDDTVFDAELAEVLKAFQREKDIQPTGMLTPRTRQALNAGAPKPTAKPQPLMPKLVINMERWRWMPEDMGTFHVWQNTPEFMVRVIKNGEVVHQAKVIVGKVVNQTPVFSASMRYVVFQPEWGVPDSIKVKEILPYLRPGGDDFFSFFGGADTRVLERHNLRVSYNGRPVDASSVNWNEVDIRRYSFTQPSGGANVLGVVKFRFPNKHDVYMHDTPQRELFTQEVRAFSHGCVRVQDPGRLAEVLLAEDKGWTREYVQGLLARTSSTPNEVELTKQIPVHLSYFTAVGGEDSKIATFADLYGHDARLTAALAGKYVPPEVVAGDGDPDQPVKGQKRKRKPASDFNLW